jgi:hypothetical protein
MAEISPIKYSKELQTQIFPDNSFYKHSIPETGIADTTETVERPYQGAIGKAKSGTPTLPLQVRTARDEKDSYSTVLVYADPIAVDLPDEFALNYNKRASKQVQQAGEINTRVANIAAVNWGPTVATNILKTSGASRASNVVITASGSAIANRKATTKADMIKVHNLLMRMNLSGIQGSLWGLVTADFYSDLLALAEFTDYDKTGKESKLAQGILGMIMGINIMTRATEEQHIGLVYSAAYAKNAIDAPVLTNDAPANLFWHDKMTATAEGALRTVITPNAPGYMGATIIETWTRFGATQARYDQKGVIALLEENA